MLRLTRDTIARGLPALFLLLTLPTHGAGLGQAQSRSLEEIIVSATRTEGSLTAPGAAAARRELARIPGAIGFVEQSEFTDDFAQSIGDTLSGTPGVFADTSAQRETRISIRGSGLNSSFERRGILLYRDGVPITRASGSTEFQEVDPTTVEYLEVYKGANALRYGGAALGGVINMVTPTGVTRGECGTLRLETGSFNTTRASASYSGQAERSDLYAAFTRLRSDGYRKHSGVDSYYAFANLGFQLGNTLENRTYLTLIKDQFELAGSLSLDDAMAKRKQASPPVTIGPFFPGGPVTVLDPGAVADDWDRNLEVLRIANTTAWQHGNTSGSLGAWHTRRSLDHAITRFAGLIDQAESEYGVFARLGTDRTQSHERLQWTAGIEYNRASNHAKTWENRLGEAGALRSRSDQRAWNLLTYGQLDLRLTRSLRGIASLQALRSERSNRAIVNDVSGQVRESQVNPRVGLLWEVAPESVLFANLSRGFEPASLSDLTAGGALDFTPLDAQSAWTLEFGSRGSHGAMTWDLAVYRSELQDELLDFGAASARGFVSFTANADKTLHQGIEAGVDLAIARTSLGARGLALTWRQLYTLNDFRFQNDTTYGNNRLAGVPRHLYISELRLETANGWHAAINLRWVPEGPYADFANTTEVPDYYLLGAAVGLQINRRLRVFGSIENLTDEAYISNTATNANQQLEDSRLFTPGQGRAAYVGLQLSL